MCFIRIIRIRRYGCGLCWVKERFWFYFCSISSQKHCEIAQSGLLQSLTILCSWRKGLHHQLIVISKPRHYLLWYHWQTVLSETDKISATLINSNELIGIPCLFLLLGIKYLDVRPLFIYQLQISVYCTLINGIKLGPKFIVSKDWKTKAHLTVSKAFSKSTRAINPVMFSDFEISTKSANVRMFSPM